MGSEKNKHKRLHILWWLCDFTLSLKKVKQPKEIVLEICIEDLDHKFSLSYLLPKNKKQKQNTLREVSNGLEKDLPKTVKL